MRGSKVTPLTDRGLELIHEELYPPEVEVVVVPTTTIRKGIAASMIQFVLRKPKGGSPVVPLSKATALEGVNNENEHCGADEIGASKYSSKSLLSGVLGAGASKAAKLPVARSLFRQHHSMPGRQFAGEPTPLRRCISAGGATGSSTATSNANNQGGKLLRTAGTKAVAAPTSGGSCGSIVKADASSMCPLIDALQSVSQAASATARVMYTARLEHEEALQKQREQFQVLLQSMRLRSGGAASSTATAAVNAANLSPEAAPATAAAAPPVPHGAPQLPSPVPISRTETYRGVHFNIPLGCRVEDGETPSEVLVLGPQTEVVLEVTDAGRNVLLVSSNCVCTVRRMDGRMYVNVLPPLGAKST